MNLKEKLEQLQNEAHNLEPQKLTKKWLIDFAIELADCTLEICNKCEKMAGINGDDKHYSKDPKIASLQKQISDLIVECHKMHADIQKHKHKESVDS